MFGGSQDDSDLSWAEPVALAELEQAMNAGALDKVDPAISSIRFIPPNTPLNNTDDNPNRLGSNSESTKPKVVTAAPTWSWTVAGVGFIGIAAALIAMLVYRRRHSLDEDNNHDFDSAAPRKSRGAFPVPLEIVDENSECDQSEVYRDVEDDEDSVMSPANTRNASRDCSSSSQISWQQIRGTHEEPLDDYTRLDINATDPNKPVVRPILDEASEIMDIYI